MHGRTQMPSVVIAAVAQERNSSNADASMISWLGDPRVQNLLRVVGGGIVSAALMWGFVSPSNPALAVQETGRKREVTRGLDLQGKDFSGQDYSGKNFQTSLLRGANFKGAILRGTNFFDSDLASSDFEGADMSEAILEVANLRKANLKNAILQGAFISANTAFEGADIEGADFSDVLLRKDQQLYLCSIASGTNETTGVSTKESLNCKD